MYWRYQAPGLETTMYLTALLRQEFHRATSSWASYNQLVSRSHKGSMFKWSRAFDCLQGFTCLHNLWTLSLQLKPLLLHLLHIVFKDDPVALHLIFTEDAIPSRLILAEHKATLPQFFPEDESLHIPWYYPQTSQHLPSKTILWFSDQNLVCWGSKDQV